MRDFWRFFPGKRLRKTVRLYSLWLASVCLIWWMRTHSSSCLFFQSYSISSRKWWSPVSWTTPPILRPPWSRRGSPSFRFGQGGCGSPYESIVSWQCIIFFPYIGNNNPNWLIFLVGNHGTNTANPEALCTPLQPFADHLARLAGPTPCGTPTRGGGLPWFVELGITRSVEKGIAQQIFTDPFVDNDFYR